MALSEALLPEFDQEMAGTRKSLERVPDDKFDWKPHKKSMTVRQLTTHLALFPSWMIDTLEKTEFDYAPVGGEPYKPPAVNSRKDLAGDLRPRCSQGSRGLEDGERRPTHGNVELACGRQDDLFHAANRRLAQHGDEPPHPSPRAAWRLSSPQ